MSLYTSKTISKNRYEALVSQLLGIAVIPRGTVPTNGLHFGMELEVENSAGILLAPNFNQYWTLHEDNSLRNNGIEFVSVGPIAPANVPEAFNVLRATLNSKPDLSYSERTSFHVHINAQDMTFKHMHCFLTLYYLLENALVLRGGHENRVGNQFCLRLCDANRMKRALINTFSGTALADVFQQERYAALNFASFGKYRTLEFRFHRATPDLNEYTQFLRALTELYNYSKTLNSPKEIFENMSAMGFSDFFLRCMPVTYFYLGGRDLTETLNDNFMFAQSLAYCVNVVEEDLKKSKKTIGDLYGENNPNIWLNEMAAMPQANRNAGFIDIGRLNAAARVAPAPARDNF